MAGQTHAANILPILITRSSTGFWKWELKCVLSWLSSFYTRFSFDGRLGVQKSIRSQRHLPRAAEGVQWRAHSNQQVRGAHEDRERTQTPKVRKTKIRHEQCFVVDFIRFLYGPESTIKNSA